MDNTKGLSDPDIVLLMQSIEETIDESDYVKEQKPVSYFKVLDALTDSKKACMSYTELERIAVDCGVVSTSENDHDAETVLEVDKMLKYFHDMGCLLWHSDEGLRDTVIVDAISYFVTPAARVVCNHAGSNDDPTIHDKDKVLLKLSKHVDYKPMVRTGITTTRLLRAMLVDADGSDTPDQIINNRVYLMVKYGLIVPLDHGSAPWPMSLLESKKFLVPALLQLSSGRSKEDGKH